MALRLQIPQYPQNAAAVLWRYASDDTPEMSVGNVTSRAPVLHLGSPGVNHQKQFLLEGAVLAQGDRTPTPYQILVAILQDDRVVHEEVPQYNGSGQLGKEDVPFLYSFKIEQVAG